MLLVTALFFAALHDTFGRVVGANSSIVGNVRDMPSLAAAQPSCNLLATAAWHVFSELMGTELVIT